MQEVIECLNLCRLKCFRALVAALREQDTHELDQEYPPQD
jgi:hypothetical protein